MEKIIDEIKREMKSKGYTQSDIAKLLKVSPPMVTQYFQMKSQLDFQKLLKILHMVFGKGYEYLILEFCRHTKNQTNIREALEWSLHRWCPGISNAILEEEKKNPTPTTKLYELMLDSREGKLSPDDLFNQVQCFRMKSDISSLQNDDSTPAELDESAQVFICYTLCLIYHYAYNNSYEMIPGAAESALMYIDKIKSLFLRRAHTLNLQEMMAVAYLYGGNKKEAKNTLKKMKNKYVKAHFPMMYVSALAIESELKAFDSYQESLDLINSAMNFLNVMGFSGYKRRKAHLESIHDFIKITHNKLVDLYLTDPEQHLYYETMVNKETALEKIKVLEKKKALNGMELYCKGLCLNSVVVMRDSENYFIDRKNMRMRKLPKKFIDDYLQA